MPYDTSRLKKTLTAAALAALVLAAWSTELDRLTRDETEQALQRALVAFATARALNAVISVAQGTELALQPAGLGVTFTPGEILDPLNDLIERFSWLVLVAATSLGAQVLLTEIFAQSWSNVLISITAFGYIVVLLWPTPFRSELTRCLGKVVVATLFLRFFVVGVTLLSTFVGEHFLSARQQLAIDTITVATAELDPPGADDAAEGLFEGLREALNVRKKIDALKAQVEIAISYLVDLMVTFVLQTLVFPLATAAAGYLALRALWRRL